MRKPSKFNVPGWNERATELNARYREAVSHWNISGSPRSGPLAELKCMARTAFRHEMIFLRDNENQLHAQSMLSKRQMEECNDFWKEIKALNLRRNPCTNSGKNFWGEQYCKPMERSIQCNSKLCWLHWQPRSGHECIGDCRRP